MSSPEERNAARSASDLVKAASVAGDEIGHGRLEDALSTLREASAYLEITRQWVYEVVRTGRCPDGGTCHHQCRAASLCSRVRDCVPLSGVFPGDRWPEDVLRAARGE
jgi:hypothetical protein